VAAAIGIRRRGTVPMRPSRMSDLVLARTDQNQVCLDTTFHLGGTASQNVEGVEGAGQFDFVFFPSPGRSIGIAEAEGVKRHGCQRLLAGLLAGSEVVKL
jgi:hypothetical protein